MRNTKHRNNAIFIENANSQQPLLLSANGFLTLTAAAIYYHLALSQQMRTSLNNYTTRPSQNNQIANKKKRKEKK